MKNYVKVVQAVQYLGDITVLKELISKKDVVEDENGVFLHKTPGESEGGYWKLKETDYIILEHNQLFVYKKERFEADFEEVVIEDLVDVKDIKEIQVNEFIEVKTSKKVVDKGKKD